MLGLKNKQKGFSILEILVSLTIIALFSAILIPSLNYIFRTNIDSFAQNLSILFREARDHAILTNQVVRIRFDLDKQSYWVEEAPKIFLLNKESPINTEEEDADTEEEVLEDPEGEIFTQSSITKEKTIPDGIRIVSIISPRTNTNIEEGLGEIYYFPHGISETAILNIEDIDDNKRNLVVNPITGKTKIENNFYKKLRERKK